MTAQFVESGNGICYRDSLSPVARAFVLLMALAMLVVPVAFLLLAPWDRPSWSMLWLVPLVGAFVAVGAVFLRLGLARTTQAFFDARTRSLKMDRRGPLGTRRLESPFEAVEDLTVERFKGLDDPDSFSLRLKLAHRRRPYHLGVFALATEAEAWQARIQSLLSPDHNHA